jgi:GNAT superfamily N-acetyltransferase
MELKIGTWDDYEDIKRMCLEFMQASPYSEMYGDLDKIETVISTILNEPKEKSIIILGVDNDKVVGMLAGQKTQMIFNHDEVAYELIFWIDPDKRGGRLAFQFMEAFEFWAKKVGCSLVQMALLETDTADKVSKLYQRKGYMPRERAFLKVI